MIRFLQRIRLVPVLVTIALFALVYLQVSQLSDRPIPGPFWVAIAGALALFLSFRSVRDWYLHPPRPAPRKFVTWMIGHTLSGAYRTVDTNHLILKEFFLPTGSVYSIGITDSPIYAEIVNRWGTMSTARNDKIRPQPGDTILAFHVIDAQLDPTPRPEQLTQATIVPLLHTVVDS